MRTFQATGRLSNGLHQEVQIKAGSQLAARAIIESMYGKGCLLHGPWSFGPTQ